MTSVGRTVTTFALAAILGGLATPVTHAAASTARYAGPNATSTACTKAAPCSIYTAISGATAGDTVYLEPGDYGGTGSLLTETIEDNVDITIVGLGGPARAVIESTAAVGVNLEAGSTLRNVVITDNAADGMALELQYGNVNDIVAISSGTDSIACEVLNGALSDSLCLDGGGGGGAALASKDSGDDPGTTWSGTARNVTAIATGAQDSGIEVVAGTNVTATLNVINTIAHTYDAAGVDAYATAAPGTDGSATLSLTSSDYRSSRTLQNSGTAAIDSGGHNISGLPRFVDPAHDNFQEKSGSPTIDRATTTGVGQHETDLAGHPRTLGSAPDIGAYEFKQKPALRALKITGTTARKLVGTVHVNGEGSPTKVKAVVTRHGHLVEAMKHPRAVTHTATVRFVLHFLKPDTRYEVRIVAHNDGGTTKTAKHTVHTKA